MFTINVKLTLVSSIFIPMIIGYSLFFHKGIGKSFEKVDIEEGKLSSIAQENLTGVRVVRAFGRESYERERFEAVLIYFRICRFLVFYVLARYCVSMEK